MNNRRSAVAQVSEHCDLQERLKIVPASAVGRGLYLGVIPRVLARADKLEEYERIMPGTYSPFRQYPVADFLERLAVAGAILRSPAQVHEGMYEIGRLNAISFAESLLGRTLIRLLSKDPIRLLQQAVASRRQSVDYGSWRVELESPNCAIMHFEREYCWIESYMLGAGVGTFESVGREADIRVELDGPYDGRHIIHWT